MATPPRFAIPGVYFITRRTLLRMFLLRPDANVNSILLYVLGLAVTKFNLQIHVFIFLSNHVHLLLTDQIGGQVSRFCQYLFSLSARALNSYHDRQESLWSNDKPNIVYVVPKARDIADKVAYILCNAVLSGLVERMNDWPGVKATLDDLGTLTIDIERPSWLFTKQLSARITFSTCLPQCEDATEEELRQMIHDRCKEIEEKASESVNQDKRKILGVEAVLKANPFDRATSYQSLFSLEPHIACLNTPLRVKLLKRLKRFRKEYRKALAAFCQGQRWTLFPWGTLKMVQFFGCRCREPDAEPNLGVLAL